MADLPVRDRVYQNHHMDSRRWDYFRSRPDDIVIATSYKAGTTWTQAIVAHLLFQDGEMPAPVPVMSPWLDMRVIPLEVVLGDLEAQAHRRFVKTHLPLDGLPYEPHVKYLYVARDARDVFMSLWNHYSNHTDETYLLFNALAGRVGDEFPRPGGDIHDFWKSWINRGWFEWETDGWPYWSHLYNVQSWWRFRQLPNLLLVHYSDMLTDLEGQMRRIARFLEIDVPEERWPALTRAVTFDEMKKAGDHYTPGQGAFWKGGAETFLHKGTNGRWRDVLSDEELAWYDAACDRTLSPDCRKWLEEGAGAAPR
jgi:aryl sulfotransferase